RNGRDRRLEEERVEAAADEVDLLPVLRIGAIEDFAAPEAADGRDEVTALDLLLGATTPGGQDLLRAVVHGVTERRSAQLATEHRDRRGVGPEVCVHVLGPVAAQPPKEEAGLDQI